MFSSLVAWCNMPFTIERGSGMSASGDKVSNESIESEAYIVGNTVLITDKEGKEYVSKTQLYLPPEKAVVTENDKITYKGSTYEIRRLLEINNWRTGAVDLQVIYL